MTNKRYMFDLKNQGTRMDGENLYGLTVRDTQWKENGIPQWMAITNYDDLTIVEANEIMSMEG